MTQHQFLFFVLAIQPCSHFLSGESPVMRVAIRVLLLPVIAGVSYEVLKLAGRSENPVVNLLSRPGLAIQKLTTREPDESMIEVAIAAVNPVPKLESMKRKISTLQAIYREGKEQLELSGVPDADLDAWYLPEIASGYQSPVSQEAGMEKRCPSGTGM